MDGNRNDSSSGQLLIDFSSPLPKHRILTPLIPIPTADRELRVSESPPNKTPFDVVARLTISPESTDPFECAFNYVCTTKQNSVDAGLKQSSSYTNKNGKDKTDNVKIKNNKILAISKVYNSNTTCDKTELEYGFEKSVNKTEILCDTGECETSSAGVGKLKIPDVMLNNDEAYSLKEVLDTNNCDSNKSYRKIKESKTNENPSEFGKVNDRSQVPDSTSSGILQCSSDSLHITNDGTQISADFSSDETIKAVVAKRVNKCIQQVLNNSFIKSKLGLKKSDENSKSVTSNLKLPLSNRRSQSFVMMSSENIIKSDKRNKSFTGSLSNDDSFIVVNHKFNTPNSSMDSSEFHLQSGEVSKNEDSSLENPEKDEVFQEANKLARTFSKIAESFCNTAADDEDLLSCKPQWLYADSSEDEEEKLKNDPALNIRTSFTSSSSLSTPDSKALLAFKSRKRRSLDVAKLKHDPQFNVENLVMKRSNSIGSKPAVAPVIPFVAPVVPFVAPVIPSLITSVPVVLEKKDDNALKLKKPAAKEPTKRGPMRAVAPLQSMTKSTGLCGSEKITKRSSPPAGKQKCVPLPVTPLKDISHMDIQPVASSTPNKAAAGMNHLKIPAVMVPPNKHRSLEGDAGSRISRPSALNDVSGARLRSNSLQNSFSSTGIPTPQRSLKAIKAPLKPNSMSNLLINQMKQKSDTNTMKKPTKPLSSKLNSKALNEVKPKNGQPGRVKSTVNTISNLITGKSKKTVARDKENRVPA